MSLDVAVDTNGFIYVFDINNQALRYLYRITTNSPASGEEFEDWIPLIVPNQVPPLNNSNSLIQSDFAFVKRSWDLQDPDLDLIFSPYKELNQVTYKGWLLYFFRGGTPQSSGLWTQVNVNDATAPTNGSPVYPINGNGIIRPSVRCC